MSYRPEIRFVLGDGYDGQHPMLRCPVCNFEYVHPSEVRIDLGHVQAVAKSDEIAVASTERYKNRRGSALFLRFWCENHHSFEYELWFEKGNMYVDLMTWPADEDDMNSELYRR